jgi:hypothetical protein
MLSAPAVLAGALYIVLILQDVNKLMWMKKYLIFFTFLLAILQIYDIIGMKFIESN